MSTKIVALSIVLASLSSPLVAPLHVHGDRHSHDGRAPSIVHRHLALHDHDDATASLADHDTGTVYLDLDSSRTESSHRVSAPQAVGISYRLLPPPFTIGPRIDIPIRSAHDPPRLHGIALRAPPVSLPVSV